MSGFEDFAFKYIRFILISTIVIHKDDADEDT